jgi:hypothetical protein
MSSLITISALLAAVYIVLITIIYGWQDSFSDTYYIKKIGWKFSAWCWTMAILLFLGLYEQAGLVFVPSFGFVVVGFTPRMRESWVKPIHFWGALLLIIVGSLLMVMVEINLVLGLFATFWVGVFSIFAYKIELKRKILWIELLAFCLIYIILFLCL